jgi:predicted nucleic acid-binding protein
LLLTRPEDLDLGLTLFERYPLLGAFDSVLAAVALNRQAEALVSTDQAFGGVPRLPWIDPATPALDRLIGE